MSGKPLEIRIVSSQRDVTRFNKLAGKFHYMGEGHPAGDTLRMVAKSDGEWMVLLRWGSAASRVK